MENSKYSNKNFLQLYDRMGKIIDRLAKARKKFELKDKKAIAGVKELLNLPSDLFDIDFELATMAVVYDIKETSVKAFFEIKLKILDKESGKNISRNTFLCGMLVDGKHKETLEIKEKDPVKKKVK